MANKNCVTASIWRTEEGDVIPEYRVDGIGYGSLAALEAALGGR